MRPTKNERDSKPTTAEPWEVEGVHQELPTHSRDELGEVIGRCKQEQPEAADRKKLLECVQRKVST